MFKRYEKEGFSFNVKTKFQNQENYEINYIIFYDRSWVFHFEKRNRIQARGLRNLVACFRWRIDMFSGASGGLKGEPGGHGPQAPHFW